MQKKVFWLLLVLSLLAGLAGVTCLGVYRPGLWATVLVKFYDPATTACWEGAQLSFKGSSLFLWEWSIHPVLFSIKDIWVWWFSSLLTIILFFCCSCFVIPIWAAASVTIFVFAFIVWVVGLLPLVAPFVCLLAALVCLLLLLVSAAFIISAFALPVFLFLTALLTLGVGDNDEPDVIVRLLAKPPSYLITQRYNWIVKRTIAAQTAQLSTLVASQLFSELLSLHFIRNHGPWREMLDSSLFEPLFDGSLFANQGHCSRLLQALRAIVRVPLFALACFFVMFSAFLRWLCVRSGLVAILLFALLLAADTVMLAILGCLSILETAFFALCPRIFAFGRETRLRALVAYHSAHPHHGADPTLVEQQDQNDSVRLAACFSILCLWTYLAVLDNLEAFQGDDQGGAVAAVVCIHALNSYAFMALYCLDDGFEYISLLISRFRHRSSEATATEGGVAPPQSSRRFVIALAQALVWALEILLTLPYCIVKGRLPDDQASPPSDSPVNRARG